MGRLDIRERYGAKLTVLLVGTMLLVGGVGVAIYYTIDTELTENTERQLEATATSDANQIDNWLRLTEHQFVGVTRSSAVRAGDSHGAYDQLARVSGQNEIVGTSLVRLSTGNTTVETGRVEMTDETDHLRPALRDRTRELSETSDQRTSYSAPFRLDGRPVVVAVTTTPSKDGRGLVSVIDLSTLSHELFDITADHQETKTVVNETGTVVLSTNRTTLLTESPVAGESFENASGALHADTGQLAVGYADTDTDAWTTTNQLPTAEAYALRDTVSKQILLLLGVLVAGLGGIGLTIGRNTVRSVTELAERANTLKAGDLETPIESERRDEFGDVYRALDAMRCSLRDEIADAEAAREAADAERERAQAAREQAVELNERLEATAAEFGATMDACAEGDLSRRLPTDTDTDAMADIAAAFNAMVAEWAATIQDVRAFGDAVEAESTAVTQSVGEAHDTSEALAGGMATIAGEATGQASDLQTVREETEQLSATVEEASASAAEVATVADEVLDNGHRGREAAQAAKDELDAIESRTDAAAQQVDQLAELVGDVEEVTDLITEIAERTNMLALNARIEAARADNDGFGAVAEEVKGLVDETQAATQDIESTIAELETQTDATAAEMADARTKVDDGAETIEEALTAFDTIVDDIEETADGISEIDQAIADQADSTQAVMSELVTVSEVSTETASAADEAAADAQTQAERMEAVSGSVNSLSAEARQLGSVLETFQTGDGTIEGEPTDEQMAEAPTASDQPATTDDTDQQSAVTDDTDQQSVVTDDGRARQVSSSWEEQATGAAATDGGSDT